MATRLRSAPVKLSLERLLQKYPEPKTALEFQGPFQLLIATILSAQCTDERVNQVTAVLFPLYPDAQAIANAELSDLEAIIRPTGFFRSKAKNIKETSRRLHLNFEGRVPADMQALTELPGVGRKTANVVLGSAFGKISGIVVDTHVKRLSFRLGWTKATDPEKIEQDLQKLIPKELWIDIAHLLILHGRAICKARGPHCSKCFLFDLCPRNGVK